MYHQVLFAGFGGQGVLACGQVLALAALIEGRQATWMPSYGPEQRGGTASCVVTISDGPIGSPLAERLSGALIFNRPSMVKFLPLMSEGSVVILNSCMVEVSSLSHRSRLFHVPADDIAREAGTSRSGNIVMLGSYIEACGIVSFAAAGEAIGEYLETRSHLVDANRKALEAGQRFMRGLWAGSERELRQVV